MSRHRLEVADVIRQHEGELLERWGRRLNSSQRKALRDIGSCRSAALGAHIEKCNFCPQKQIAYNSCSNRHCPKCQSAARDRWLAAQAEELLRCRAASSRSATSVSCLIENARPGWPVVGNCCRCLRLPMLPAPC